MTDTKVETDKGEYIDPMSPTSSIPDDALIYVINNSPSNKVLSLGKERQILKAPGYLGSVQLITKKMMGTPGFMALWTTDQVRVSLSADIGKAAVSEAQMNMIAEKKREREVQQSIVEDEGNGVAGDKVTDVSEKAKNFEGASDLGSSDQVLNVPRTTGRGRGGKKKDESDGKSE